MKFLNMTDYLFANVVLADPPKLEMDLTKLLSKESFAKVINENVSDKNKEEKK